MNSFIENLNQWGGNFLSFVWPMFWQSGLLIAVLFTFDFLFRHQVRASVRYVLWLVVLVKLCVPPTLALPTSPVWWLHKTPPPVVAKPARHYMVTYDDGPLPQMPQAPLPAFDPPTPAMIPDAWLLVTSAFVSLTLLGWLLVRWWQITQLVRHAKTSDRLATLAGEAQAIAGMRRKVQLRLTRNAMSPAVCGLFRPAILIPQSLADNFSDEQLRAVLLHELIHLRRRDVWLNFVQAFLQIFYWWHPLVWLANARIRRVREEAVDDAVMLALRDEAEYYAPTLLEVAKLALNRPLASLGLVGILESHHALRQRIERLVDFSPPREAGLTLVSLLGILAFTAVAVPMGDGPSSPDKNNLPAIPALVTSLSSTPTNAPVILIQAEIYRMSQTDFAKLISDPVFVSTRQDKVENFQQLKRLLKFSGFPPIARPRIQTANGLPAEFNAGNETNSIEFECRPVVTNGLIDLASRIKIISMTGAMKTTNEFTNQSILENGGGHVFSIRSQDDSSGNSIVVVTIGAEIVTNQLHLEQRLQSVIYTADGAQTNFQITTNVVIDAELIEARAAHLVQDAKLYYEMGKLDDAEKLLQIALSLDAQNNAAKYYLGLVQSARISLKWGRLTPEQQNIAKKLDRIRIPSVSFDHLGLGEVVRQLNEAARENDPNKLGVNISTVTNSVSKQQADINSVVINVPALADASLADVLDAVLRGTKEPVKYSIMDDGVIFALRDVAETNPLYSRHFRVETTDFIAAMRTASSTKTNNISAMARDFFKTLGVDLDVPGKSVFFNDGKGELFVRGTATDLDTIENALERLRRPQIHIKARFVEVPKATFDGLKSVYSVTNQAVQSNQLAGLVRILTDESFRTVLHSLEALPGAETLAEPEVVTTSGRQTQMRVTITQAIVTNFVFQETSTNASIVPQTSQIETGPILDTIPNVLSDGYTINLVLIPSLVEFLGYDRPTNTTTVYDRAGGKIDVPKVLPKFNVRQMTTTLNLWDNQTAIISGLPEKDYVNGKEVSDKSKSSDKELLVFVTATIVDPAGNRVHSDDELPFAKDGIPPQPPHE